MRLRVAMCLTFAGLLAGGCGGDDGANGGPETVVIHEPKVYRVGSSAMEPTLHCAKPGTGCEASEADLLEAEPVEAADIERGDIVVFETPPEAATKCGAGGTFIQRVVGLPGETIAIRVEQGAGFVYLDGERLDEPYVEDERRELGLKRTYNVPANQYFLMGDNRAVACDSRIWGPLPAENISRRVTKIIREK